MNSSLVSNPAISLGSAHRQVLKRLVRLMGARHWGAGDRLPPQDQLRKILDANNRALSAAMACLVRAGVLQRKPRVGTLVNDLTPLTSMGWTVGVATFAGHDEKPDSFFVSLAARIQAQLAQRRCHTLSFTKLNSAHPPATSDFFGLDERIDADQLDGLILLTPLQMTQWRRLEQAGLALCHTPLWKLAPRGVVIDGDAMTEQAVVHLHQLGCRAIAMVDSVDQELGGPRFLPGYERGLSATGARPVRFIRIEATNVGVGAEIAHSLRRTPGPKRPDGLIVYDDHVAMGLTQTLREAGDYQPKLAVQTNSQLPRYFGLPVTRFEVDMDDLAQRSVNLLLQALIDPGVRGVEQVAPRLATEQPARLRTAAG